MTREELLALVNAKEDTTKFVALSKKTIEEELDDALEEIGEDEAVNDKIVEKLAKRLKRMDGNVHINVSTEAKKNKDAERKRKEEEERKKKEEQTGSGLEVIEELKKEIQLMKEKNAAREKEEAKKATLKSVRNGLKAKFDEAKIEMNDTLANIVFDKMNISEDDTDIASLVNTAEAKYTALKKELGISDTMPKKGRPEGIPKPIGEHEWDDIKNL